MAAAVRYFVLGLMLGVVLTYQPAPSAAQSWVDFDVLKYVKSIDHKLDLVLERLK